MILYNRVDRADHMENIGCIISLERGHHGLVESLLRN
jgi:hypothetical protein